MTTVRKGLSSIKFAKILSVTQKKAWSVEHCIHKVCDTEKTMLSGGVEIYETCLGRIEKNKHVSKRQNAGRGAVGKAAVVALRERSGAAVAMHVDKADKATLYPIIERNVQEGSSAYTEEYRAYTMLNRTFDHHAVKHSAGEYVTDHASTNNIELFRALLKRICYGTLRWWSFKHLHRYVSGFVYRQNARELKGLMALDSTIRASESKHLSYADLVQT